MSEVHPRAEHPSSAAASSRTDSYAARLESLSQPEDHISLQLGWGIQYDERGAVGRAFLRPAMWGEGSRRPRLAIVAMLLDVLGGHVPDPVRLPTVDLRIQLSSEPPASGAIEAVGRPLRTGRRLVVSEYLVYDAEGNVFARGTTTVVNHQLDGWRPKDEAAVPANPIASFDRLLAARIVDDRTLELDLSPQISNGVIDTPHGGAQMLFAELAAEHLAGSPRAAVDLDARLLRPLEEGPLRATAMHTGRVGSLDAFRVDLNDAGAQDTPVAVVTILSRPLAATELG